MNNTQLAPQVRIFDDKINKTVFFSKKIYGKK